MIGIRTCLGAGTVSKLFDEAYGGVGGFLMFLVMRVVQVAFKSRVGGVAQRIRNIPAYNACRRPFPHPDVDPWYAWKL